MRVFRCFAFVDLCGFTRMNDTLGDDEALNVLATFRGIVRGLSPEHATRVGKWLGDGCMFIGTEVKPIVETVLDLSEQMEKRQHRAAAAHRRGGREGHRVRGRRLHRDGDQPRVPAVRRRRAREILVNDAWPTHWATSSPWCRWANRSIPGIVQPISVFRLRRVFDLDNIPLSLTE